MVLQVVAGTNFKLNIKVKDTATGKTRKLEVVVFRSLPPDLQLKLMSVNRVPHSVKVTASGSPPTQTGMMGTMMMGAENPMAGRKLRL